MFTVTQLQKGIRQRAKALSIPKTIYIPISREVVKWYRSSGEEWLVDRMKAIKLDIIRKKAGMPPVSSWISKGPLFFKGPFGLLERWMQKSVKHFSRGIQLTQLYTLFYAPGITERQKTKFMEGVQCTPPLPEYNDLAKVIIDRGFDLMYQKRTYKRLDPPQSLTDMIPSPSRRAPLPDRSVKEEEGIVDSLRFLFESTQGFKHYIKYKRSHYIPAMQELWDVLRDPENRVNNKDVFNLSDTSKSFLVGRIGLIQESGYKLRAVANPGRIFQRVLQPLGNAIYDYLKDVPYDCTFNQSKSFPVLQEALSHGKTVHSIDLSGATDYFPLSLQEHLLFKMFPKSDVELFVDLSKATWYMPQVGNISWMRGQPLGLYPSFGAFALTHGCLLLGLLNKEWNNQFFILGDDVVILDDQLAHDYYNTLAYLGCPVSMSKSLSSSSLCEFGGKLISSSTIISQYKWRDVSDDSFIDIARIVGPKSLPLFKPRQLRIIRELSEIPDFLGGLGWNPKGLPLEDRLNSKLIWLDKVPVDHLMDYSSVRIRNLLKSKIYQRTIFTRSVGVDTLWIDKDRDLDQRSSLLIKSLLPSSLLKLDKRILGKNVDSISLNLFGSHANLPINTLDGSTLRPTLLSMWESKVRHVNG